MSAIEMTVAMRSHVTSLHFDGSDWFVFGDDGTPWARGTVTDYVDETGRGRRVTSTSRFRACPIHLFEVQCYVKVALELDTDGEAKAHLERIAQGIKDGWW
jgi:hypothetical protein